MTPRDRDGLVEKIARGIWASEFIKSPEECRAEPATDEDPDPGWWVGDQWDAVLDTARVAFAVVERERPPLTEEQAEAATWACGWMLLHRPELISDKRYGPLDEARAALASSTTEEDE